MLSPIEFALNTLLVVKKSGPEQGITTSFSPSGVGVDFLAHPLMIAAATTMSTKERFAIRFILILNLVSKLINAIYRPLLFQIKNTPE
jgi:hypothetical protein